MSAKNSTLLNTLLGLTWGAATTSPPLYVFLPLNLAIDLVVNLVLGIREVAGAPARENWFSHWAFRDAYFGMRSERQGVLSLALNGLIPRVLSGRFPAMTTGQVVWARQKNLDWHDLPRMLEVWDIDGAPALDAFDSSALQSAIALVATTGGKVRLHATSWSRGFGNSVAGDSFTDKKLPGDLFARGMIHLAEPLPVGFLTGDNTALRVDEYTITAASRQSIAAIEASLSFILSKGSLQPGQFVEVSAPKVSPAPRPVVAKIMDVTTEPYEGFYRQIEFDAVTLETELPQSFAGGKLRVRRLLDTGGTARSGPWQGGPAELTQPQADTLPAFARPDLLRIEAGGGEITFAPIHQIELELHLTPPLLERPEQASVELLRADAAFTATVKDFTEPAKLTLTAGHPAVAKDHLLLVRLGVEKKHVIVTAVSGEEITIFPALDFAQLQLHAGTLVNVQRWVLTTEGASFKSADGDTITVIPPRASLFSKGSMVSFIAGGKRAFREVEQMTDIKITLSGSATGTAPFTIETAQYDKFDKTGIDVVTRHRRLRFVSGADPSAYGKYPQFLLGIRPRLPRPRSSPGSRQSETIFCTNGLANADPAHHRTWKPFSEGAESFWLLGGDLPVETDGADTVWRFNPRIENKFEGKVEVDLIEYTKARATRADGTPAGARIRVHAPEVQVPESPSITDTHVRAIFEHELKHVQQCAHWGPLMFMLPVPGVAKLVATLEVAAGDNPPGWAQRLLDNQGLEKIEFASIGGLMQLLYELFVPGELETETWQQIFNPVGGTLARLIPDLDPNAGGGEKFGVALLQILGHALDLRSWTPFLGLYPWLAIDSDRSFIEQQASRASGEMYSTTLSADDRFNADYKTYFIPHTLRDADGDRILGSATRMMTWTGITTRPLLSHDHANGNGSPLVVARPGDDTSISDFLFFKADAEVLVAGDLYSATAGTVLAIEGPASLSRSQSNFHVVAAGDMVTPRLRSFVPTPPRVNRSTGYYFIPAAPASYTLTADGFDTLFGDAPLTNVVRLKVAEGKVTFGKVVVPWARPAAVGAPLDALPVLRMPEGSSRLLSINGPITGWTADLDSTAQFTLRSEAQGWRIIAPNTFAANVRVRVRLYRLFQPDDPAFDLTYKGVPTLEGVRSLLVAPAWIPVRDFVIELAREAEVVLNGNPLPAANFIGWSPRPATIRLTGTGGATGPVTITLRNPSTSVGKVVFSTSASAAPTDTLQLTVPADGSTVSFFVRGKFGSPSKADKDAVIEAVNEDGEVMSRTELMVRVRKNAMKLTTDERDRFISALAIFNNKGLGRFRDIWNMHLSAMVDEAHFSRDPLFQDGFLSWHRAYVLDLERELQAIDPSVTIPYWRFDAPAPDIFTADFFGEPATGSVRFSSTNPLKDWVTDGLPLERTPRFTIATEPAGNLNGPVINEADTLALGTNYPEFVGMEGQPHGRAHTSFDGPINSLETAPRDPLFFLIHANVDRLWAKWQRKNTRFDAAVAGTYSFLGRAGDVGATRIGHNLLDTMWPWNDVTGGLRPTTAPGDGLPSSPVASAPPKAPTVGDMIDYQGRVTAGLWLGFDYDDVEF